MALRPAGICWTPKSTKPFQKPMLKSASTKSLGQSPRGIAIDSPDRRETMSMPTAASGSVKARNVSGAISVTPILRIGQLQPHTSVSTRIGQAERAIGAVDGRTVAAILTNGMRKARPGRDDDGDYG